MNRINKRPSAKFVSEYAGFALDQVVAPLFRSYLSSVPAPYAKELAAYFNRDKLLEVIVATPDRFEVLIEDIYTRFPILAERYCYSIIFGAESIPFHLVPNCLATKAERQALDVVVHQALTVLRRISSSRDAPFTTYLIAQLESPLPAFRKRRILNKVKAVLAGSHKFSKVDRSVFPAWVEGFAVCFDFDQVVKKFGKQLCALWDVSVCPYCALVRIERYETLKFKPELDHFYPRTRFPFLAVSLYNLIPACSICNQKCKRNHPMIGHAHPMLQGCESDSIFGFGYTPDVGIEQSLRVKLKIPLLPCKSLNIERFKLAVIYNENKGLRGWFDKTYREWSAFKELGDTLPQKLRDAAIGLMVDVSRPCTDIEAQAFKVAAVNDITGADLQTVHQPAR